MENLRSSRTRISDTNIELRNSQRRRSIPQSTSNNRFSRRNGQNNIFTYVTSTSELLIKPRLSLVNRLFL
ncbi:hypothetical protein GLOIN_2v670577 [Rhizophagus irregularis DAOM 181602=DAOM 197198]|uniref:Uncharacterized protein n=1 Tax=Rhizophagus irregularis (strain DAOM 181602 / DAOM 197198 / MUCL 43194) TaxID=747089 RepID=A0A2P4P8P2_RHIID|nr:hypothetical protein GLOIN_2v670577 [Rhizophagus irregularis DAOM 181602=DAOM 197198]POG61744.1 hypothetical protein GLOIN_2v670577 [Rhizophagus irregularis DAOM 181602=DAOM 197198]|eukprot:XP_025168610.1 hypothetical protein GLOIN_2v670577 [Rhizophagus irregularis DAOM 181602=DAOM 197198]